ncbi:MAG: hypothetical protein Q7V17_06465 [Afipia sp.]|nr:hypothetical protein [Afipia sp.]
MGAGLSRKAVQIENWATDTLLRANLIAACPEHGYMRLRFNHAAIDYAHALAEHAPFPGMTAGQSRDAVDKALDRLSDDCPACD